MSENESTPKPEEKTENENQGGTPTDLPDQSKQTNPGDSSEPSDHSDPKA